MRDPTRLLPGAQSDAAARAQRRRGLTIALAAAALLVSLAVLGVVLHWTLLDLRVYTWGGLVARHSGDLYTKQFPHLRSYHLLFTYPPMAALVFAVVSAVPAAALDGLVSLASIAALITTLWLAWGKLGYSRSAGRLAATLAAAAVALWLEPVQQTLAYGQVNLILMLVIVADLGMPDTRRAKGIGVGLAAGFKLTPLIFIPYLLLTRRFRAAAVSLVTFALTIGVSFVLLPAQSRRYWIRGLFLNSRRAGSNAAVSNQSLNGTLTRLVGGLFEAHPYWIAAAVIVGAAGLLLAARASRRGQEMLGIVTCAVTGLLLSPISWAHHWVWVAPALVVAADQAVRSGRRVAWAGVAALAAPFFLLPQHLVSPATIKDIHAHPAPLLTGNLYVITGLVMLVLVGLHLRPYRAGPLRPPATRRRSGTGSRGSPPPAPGPDRAPLSPGRPSP